MKIIYIIAITLLSAFTNALSDPNYYMVFDAGSSGTRLSLFEVIPAEVNGQLPAINRLILDQSQVDDYRVKPGISSLIDNPEGLWPLLDQLFEKANDAMLVHQIDPADVQVYFHATAGMRLIPEAKRNAYFSMIKDYMIKRTPFQSIQTVSMISGEQEGTFAWLAVNYDVMVGEDSSATKIVMDLGGASMQISANLGINPEQYNLPYTTFKVKGNNYHIASTSFLGFGLNLVLSRVSNYWQQTYNVCLPKQYTADYIDNPAYIPFSYAACERIFLHYMLSRGEYNANFRHIFNLINSRAELQVTGLDNFYFVMNYFDANSPQELVHNVQARCSGTEEADVPFLAGSFTIERECPKAIYLLSVYQFLGFDHINPKMDFYRQNWTRGVVASIILEQNP